MYNITHMRMGNLPGSATVSEYDILQVFNWSGIFYYDGKYNRSDEIATDTAEIKTGTSGFVKIPPGRFHQLNITSVDDRNQTAHPVFFVNTNDTSVSSVDITTTYVSNKIIKLRGKRNSNISIHLQSIGSRSWSVTINVTLDECPPGFYYPSNENNPANEKVCKCSTGTSNQLYGISDCNNELLIAYLNPQYWAGYVVLQGKYIFLTSNCPKDYCSATRIQIPANLSTSQSANLVCSHHRIGCVCGKCQSGYYVYANSLDYNCGTCNDTLSNHGLLILIISKYLPLTLLMCFIVFFDISLVNGPLNAFILCSQILFTLQMYGNGKIGLPTEASSFANVLIVIATFLYNIWNLNFIEILLPQFCAFRTDSALTAMVLSEYIPAFYVLILCVIFFHFIPWINNCCVCSRLQAVQNCTLKMERMCIRFRHRWSVKNSVINSLTTFLVLSYARITLVTFKLLTPTVLYGPGGQDSLYKKTVVWFDGTKSYFGSEHLPYALSALLILMIFVIIPPVLLLSYPLLPVLTTQLRIQDNWIVKKLICNPLSKCIPIFDAFQSCYKDKYRFFAGLLFVYRLAALAVFAFTPTTATNLAWIQGFLLSILLLHCVCQPYKKNLYNFVEGSIFVILISITVITFYRLFQAETTHTPTNASFWIQTVLLYCPLAYFVIYMNYRILLWLHPRVMSVKQCLHQLYHNNGNHLLDNADLLSSHEFPGRIESDDEHYSNSDSTTESVMSGDEQQDGNDGDDDDDDDNDDDVEMIHSVQWNNIDDGSYNNNYKLSNPTDWSK